MKMIKLTKIEKKQVGNDMIATMSKVLIPANTITSIVDGDSGETTTVTYKFNDAIEYIFVKETVDEIYSNYFI